MQKRRMKEILNTKTGNFMLFRRDIVNYILKIFVLVNRPDIKCSIIIKVAYCSGSDEELSPVLRQSTAEFMKNVPTSNIVFLQMKSLE